MPEVGYERRGAAAVITIDRPERRNAVDPSTADQLLEAYRRFEADDEARVMILTGAGEEAFCAGADLKSVAAAMNDQGIAQQWLKPRPDGPLGFTRLTPSKPTIAAISGWALAGGLELALWCDLRVGDRDRAARLPRAALGRAADRRRHAAPAADRRHGPRAGHDPHRPDRRGRRGARDGPR